MSKKSNCELLKAQADAQQRTESAYARCEQLLRLRGWIYTSNTPNCYWLWQKKLSDGRTVLVSRDLAILFEIVESDEHWPPVKGTCHDEC